MKTLTIEHLAAYLPYNVKVSYTGILNGKEIGDFRKKYRHLDLFESPKEDAPVEVIGRKVGHIKIIERWNKSIKYRIGNKASWLQTHYNTNGFKPLLRLHS